MTEAFADEVVMGGGGRGRGSMVYDLHPSCTLLAI